VGALADGKPGEYSMSTRILLLEDQAKMLSFGLA
jgi:hypothetical protein